MSASGLGALRVSYGGDLPVPYGSLLVGIKDPIECAVVFRTAQSKHLIGPLHVPPVEASAGSLEQVVPTLLQRFLASRGGEVG